MSGRLVILAGLPGSGKTTVARYLAAEHDFVIASRDEIRSAMFPRCRFTAAEKASAFTAMKDSIATMVEMGMAVTTDGICFSSSRDLNEIIDIATSRGIPHQVVLCDCPVDEAERRVEDDRRRDPAGVPADRDAAMVRLTADRFEPLPRTAVTIDTAQSVDQVRRDVDAVIAGLPGDR